jgi:hypothetical protein
MNREAVGQLKAWIEIAYFLGGWDTLVISKA